MDAKGAGIGQDEYDLQYNTEGREPFHWSTKISWKNRDRIMVRGYDVNELAEHASLADMVFLLFQGRLPSLAEERMLTYQMVSFMEHAFSPSVAAARAVAVGRPPVTAAIAAGILTFGTAHGPGWHYASFMTEYMQRGDKEGWALEKTASTLVTEFRAQKKNIPGLHQPQHTNGDPRAEALSRKAEELGVAGRFVKLQKLITAEYERQSGNQLRPNVLGAGGSVLLDLGFDPMAGWAIGVLTRGISCAAHAIEEMTEQSPWRASASNKMVDLLDLALQGPKYYRGPETRRMPSREERLAAEKSSREK